MKHLAGTALLAAVIVAAPVALAKPFDDRPALAFGGAAEASDTGENTRFSRSVTARYGAGARAADVVADARAQGFSCADDKSCTRAVMDGACANAFTIDIADDGAVSGRHVYRCFGAAEDDE